jgi:hypothetical protein
MERRSRSNRLLPEHVGARGANNFPAERSGQNEREVGHAPLARERAEFINFMKETAAGGRK